MQIAELELGSGGGDEDDRESAYAAYVNGKLARIAVLNMREYNYTVNGTSDVLNTVPRPLRNYTFPLPPPPFPRKLGREWEWEWEGGRKGIGKGGICERQAPPRQR